MNTLDIARNGRSAARQIRAQMDAGVLTQAELTRLLAAVEAGFDQMIGGVPARPAPPPMVVIQGGRRWERA